MKCSHLAAIVVLDVLIQCAAGRGGEIPSQFAYVTNEDSDTVSVIDMTTNTIVTTINVGDEPRWMALTLDGLSLYLVNHGSNDLYVISTEDNTVTTVVDVGSGPCWVEMADTEQFAGVANRDGGSFSIIEVSTNEVIAELQFDPNALTNWGKCKVDSDLAQQLGRDVVITLNEGTDEVVIMGLPLNGEPPFVEATIDTGVGSAPRWTDVLHRPDGSLSYISNGGNNTISILDYPSLKIVDTIDVGQGPYWVRHSPDANFGYVVNVLDNTVSKFSLSINNVVATIPVGQNPRRLVITDDSAFVLVPNFDDNTVSVISASEDKVVETISVGVHPNWIDISKDGAQAYVVNRGSNNVSVIDIGAFIVTATIPVGINPNQVITRPHEHVHAVCEGDANGDGTVDPLDAGFVLARFGCAVGTGDSGCDAADVNGDGEVNPLDSGFVLARFGPCD